MDESIVLEIATQAMTATAKLAAPVLLTSLFIGLFIGLIQTCRKLLIRPIIKKRYRNESITIKALSPVLISTC